MTEFQDPADPAVDTTPRTATLEVRPVVGDTDQTFVSFRAANGEPLGIGEVHPTRELGEASRGAWLRAMIEVLENEGYSVIHEDGS